MDKLGVSIVCNTYNQEQYISEALESFLMQKTNFGFEILVHDDASKDRTAEIIRTYQKKYPDIIKPIYQKENQYSKDPRIITKTQFARAAGKYIALCEGDDYWTDPMKLQKQFDIMEQMLNVDICAHKVTVVDSKTQKKVGEISPANEKKIFKAEEVILGGGGFVSTNSLFFRAELNKNVPLFRKLYDLDYTLQIHGALHGGMIYLPDDMGTYRKSSSGSWTNEMSQNIKKKEEHGYKILQMLEELNKETSYMYTDIINELIMKWQFWLLSEKRDYYEMIKHPYYSKLKFKCKMKIFLKRLMKYKNKQK